MAHHSEAQCGVHELLEPPGHLRAYLREGAAFLVYLIEFFIRLTDVALHGGVDMTRTDGK